MKCPIATAMDYLGKKWTIEIIRDLFLGKKHFNEILESNQKPSGSLSGKVLTERLKELRENGIIEKVVLKSFPISIEYHLTDKGERLELDFSHIPVLQADQQTEAQIIKTKAEAFKVLMESGEFSQDEIADIIGL